MSTREGGWPSTWKMIGEWSRPTFFCGIILLAKLICKSTMINKAFFISDIQVPETVIERHDKQERFHISSRTDRKSQTDWLNSSESIASSLWLFVQSRVLWFSHLFQTTRDTCSPQIIDFYTVHCTFVSYRPLIDKWLSTRGVDCLNAPPYRRRKYSYFLFRTMLQEFSAPT